MKKIILSTIFSILLCVPAFSIGINVGVSGTMGVFHATGTDTETGPTVVDTSSEDVTGVVGYTSVFIEKTLGDRITLGVDYVPDALESQTASSTVDDLKGIEAANVTAKQIQKVQVDFKDLTTVYLAFNVTESLYVKAGYVQVDIITNETLATGSTYNNTDMSGETFGIGYNKSFDNGMFARVEGSYTDFGSVSLTASNNTDNKITLGQLEGAAGKISIGKSF
jgi:hypothetical protein